MPRGVLLPNIRLGDLGGKRNILLGRLDLDFFFVLRCIQQPGSYCGGKGGGGGYGWRNKCQLVGRDSAL